MSDIATYETINTNYDIINIGLFWVHLGNIKRRYSLDTNAILIKLSDIKNTKLLFIEDIVLNIDNVYRKMCHKYFLYNFFDIDKKYVTQDFCDKFLKKPLEYAIKHFNIE